MIGKTKLWYLENFNLFEGLSKDKMMELARKLRMHRLNKGQVIYFPEEPSDSIFLVKEGQVKLSRISDDGKEIITSVLNPGEIFGEESLGEGARRQDIATAMDETLICTISRRDFEELLIENPRFNLRITKLIGFKLQRVERELESLVFKDSPSRVIEFLVRYANDYGKKIGFEIFIKSALTHQDIANLTATSRQTVTTVLNRLREKNLIGFTRSTIIIRDLEKLRNTALSNF